MSNFEFPLVLSGPIVRRVEPGSVFLWIATSKRFEIEAKFYKIESNNGDSSFDYQIIETVSEPMTVKAGKHLFIHLIKVTPMSGLFPTDILLGYNLRFRQDSEQHDLKSLQLLSQDNPHSIVYGKLKFPAFQIKSGSGKGNLLYGSCRKPHGAGEDTLALADTILEKSFQNLEERPDALFLMGDQIYADDVADPLIRVISTMSEELMGKQEPLQLLEPQLEQKPLSAALNQINGRQFIMENFCQFTSSQAQNHLIQFGEFAAMYLLSWNPELWKTAQVNQLFDSFLDAESKNLIHFAFPKEKRSAKEHRLERMELKNRFNDQQEALITFQESLYQVRRLLANIPTYMIFDDHDITDDWNLSADWRRNARNSPLGSHVIANGLTAYWAFQGWGNNPDSFDGDYIERIESYFEMIRDGEINSHHDSWLNGIWNFDSWHFVAPTHPKTVFLDTRTQREYESVPKPVKFGHIISETAGCPQLISKNGWSHVTNSLLTSGWQNGTPLIVVSATPVYGMGLIESFLHDFVYPFKVIGVEVQTSFDFEAWKYNGKGFTELLFQVAGWNPSECIFLSGDVHYASAVKATVTFSDERKLSIQQYTSSPLKNMSFSGLWGLLMKGVITLNSFERKNKDIYRVCDESHTITQIDQEETSESYLWKDQLRYQFLEKSSIIETENNLGFLTIEKGNSKNTLLTK